MIFKELWRRLSALFGRRKNKISEEVQRIVYSLDNKQDGYTWKFRSSSLELYTTADGVFRAYDHAALIIRYWDEVASVRVDRPYITLTRTERKALVKAALRRRQWERDQATQESRDKVRRIFHMFPREGSGTSASSS